MKKKLLVFSPFSDIWAHAFPESLVANSLRHSGWDIEYLTCNGLFQAHCSSMAARGVTEFDSATKKAKICESCNKRRDLLSSSFPFKWTSTESLLASEDEIRIQQIIKTVTQENWTDLLVDDVALGRYAIYEMWLNNKLVDTRLTDRMFAAYTGQLANTLRAYFAAKNYFSNNECDSVMVYNDHYSVNHAVCAAALRVGIPAYTIHGGWHMKKRAESMAIMSSGYSMAHVFDSTGWKKFSKNPISAEDVELVSQHFDGLWEAASAFAYSSGLEGTDATAIRAKLGIQEHSKVLLAPMSSEDEIIGVQLIDGAPTTNITDSLFADQLEWIRYLFRFAENHRDLQLIIRLHPRMYPNKREQVLSPVVQEIVELEKIAPINVVFNTPSQEIGLYDLAQIVDVVLNYKSSVGAELLALGIPVVVPANSDFFTYPNELNKTAYSTIQYEQYIIEAVEQGWSIENSRLAFRWFAFLFGRVAIDFSANVSSQPIAFRPKKPGLFLGIWKLGVSLILQYGPLVKERISLRRRNLPPEASVLIDDVLSNRLNTVSDSLLWRNSPSSEVEETNAISNFFGTVLTSRWSRILESNSLAGRVRSFLNETEHF